MNPGPVPVVAKRPDVLVIGGGLHGLSAALQLASGGLRVTLVERDWVGRHASGATAAGVRTLGRDPSEIPISLEAMEMWYRIEELTGDNCGFFGGSQLCIAETAEELQTLVARAAKVAALGYGHEEVLDAAEVRRIAPCLGPRVAGGLVAQRDGAADPHRTIRAFRRAAERAGVEIREGCTVTAIDRSGDEWVVEAGDETFILPVVINAAGAWAARIAALAGEQIALGMKASMMIVTERLAPFLEPVLSLAGRPLTLKQSNQGTVVIGGGLQGSADLDTMESRVRFGELARGARAAVDLVPALRDVRITRTWTGIEARTRDQLPVLGPSSVARGLYHSFGYSGHGFQLVPVSGAILAELILEGRTSRDIAAFSPARLAKADDAGDGAAATTSEALSGTGLVEL